MDEKMPPTARFSASLCRVASREKINIGSCLLASSPQTRSFRSSDPQKWANRPRSVRFAVIGFDKVDKRDML